MGIVIKIKATTNPKSRGHGTTIIIFNVLVHLFVQIYGSNKGQHGVPRNLLPVRPIFKAIPQILEM